MWDKPPRLSIERSSIPAAAGEAALVSVSLPSLHRKWGDRTMDFGRLYFSNAPDDGTRTRHSQAARAETAAALDFSPDWHSHLFGWWCAKCRRARLPARMQYIPDFFVQSATVGSL